MRRGATLIELLVVVLILGIIASTSSLAIMRLASMGKVNGAAGQLQRAMANARLRAVTTRCPHLVIITGPTFDGAPVRALFPDAPSSPNSISILRKGDCTSNALGYEVGVTPEVRDRVVSQVRLPDRGTGIVYALNPSGVVPNNMLEGGALYIRYDALGGRRVGYVATGVCEGPPTNLCVDSSPLGNQPLTLSFADAAGETRRTVVMGVAATAILANE